MKIFCLQDNLKNNLSTLERVSGKNINLPITSTCLIETQENGLKMSSTDLDLGVEMIIPAKIEKQGKAAISIKVLADFINNLPNEKIELETINNNLMVRCGRFKSVINGENPADFPILPKIKDMEKEKNELLFQEFKNAVNQVTNVVSQLSTRPELSGVYIKLEGGELVIASTDGVRLAEKRIKHKTTHTTSFILPLKTAYECVKMFDDEGKIHFIATKNQIMFFSNTTTLISRLIEGEYPNYKQLIPREYATHFVVEKSKLSQLIKAVSPFSGRGNEVRITITKNTIRTSAVNIERGEGESEEKIKLEGDELEIALNYKYIMDGISNIQTKELFIGLNGRTSAVVLAPHEDTSYTYLLMPIRS